MPTLLPIQPAYGTPENDLIVQVLLAISKVFAESEPWPDASALLRRLEAVEEIGWKARWALQLAVERSRTCADSVQGDAFRYYVNEILSDAAIADAVRGDSEREQEFKSSIDELFRRSAKYRGSAAFREMIEFTARFREYAPYDNLLVKIQNPSCGFYATARNWKLRFDRDIIEDARPLLILAPMHPVMLVCDLDQTEGPPLPQKLTDFATTSGEFEPQWMEHILANAERDRILVRFQELSSTHGGFAMTRLRDQSYKMRIAVHNGLNQASAFSVLCHELAHIYLGHLGSDKDGWWPSRINLSHATVEIEAEATSYIVATRLGLSPVSESYLSSFVTEGSIPETVSVELITKVAGKLIEMVKRKLPLRKKLSAGGGQSMNQ